ncbi:hypothetical protein BC351_23200 [Paenibacillus ferrarius]|uniref:FucIase n=1 Tax=Paenibacillus ferrarius TaxID=1469647 RepID=A0A1V4HMG4_9BACL|nr:hypothetical protein BC351_23200 [Paenibacillus ferrarius]
MNMAQAVAAMLSETLKYPNGEPVECIIADTCIGGVAEAAAAADKFAKSGVGALRDQIRILPRFKRREPRKTRIGRRL